MSYIQQSLAPGEQIVALFRLHWFVWLRVWLVLLIGLIVIVVMLGMGASKFGSTSLGSVWWIALIVAVIACLIAFYEWITLRAIEQGVTNHRVIRKTGLISRQSTELRLASIETVDLKQSFWGRVFRYADIEITGRGETAMLLRRLADPLAVKRAIETAYSQNVDSTRVSPAA